MTWQDVAEQRQKVLRDSCKPEWLLPADQLPGPDVLDVVPFLDACPLLTAREQELVHTGGSDLVAQMAAGTLTAVETMTAFLKRAHVAHQMVNFATEFLVEDALARAAALDAHFQETGKTVGPLHGLPISVKEHVGMKGRVTHGTYVALCDNVLAEDALILRILAAAGAVFHVRTNQPQTLMHLDCANYLTGTTCNPHNRKLTPGGSSGGEGASISLHCAVMGIGTDIGGSIRAPAALCGTFGLRPTALRNPYKGATLPGDSQESIRSVIGPLTNSVADINLFQKVLIGGEPWDEETSLVPLPWKTLAPPDVTSFTVGIIWDDGIVHPHPPILRGLKYAAEKLKAAGVNVVDFEPFNHKEGWDIISALYFPDGAKSQMGLLLKGGEPIAPLTQWAFDFSSKEPLTIPQNWALNRRRETYRAEYHRVMKERGVDFILCPTYLSAGAELASIRYWGYTSIWNVLDQPCVIFPTGLRVDPAVDAVDADYKPRSQEDETEYKKYNPELLNNAPIGLQLVGKHFRDEDTVAAAEVVAKIVQG